MNLLPAKLKTTTAALWALSDLDYIYSGVCRGCRGRRGHEPYFRRRATIFQESSLHFFLLPQVTFSLHNTDLLIGILYHNRDLLNVKNTRATFERPSLNFSTDYVMQILN